MPVALSHKRDMELLEHYPLSPRALLSSWGSGMHTWRVRSSAKFHENCYTDLSYLLDYGYRIREEREAQMIRKSSGGGGNGAEYWRMAISTGDLIHLWLPPSAPNRECKCVEYVQATRQNSRQLIDDGSVPRLSLRILLNPFIAIAKWSEMTHEINLISHLW